MVTPVLEFIVAVQSEEIVTEKISTTTSPELYEIPQPSPLSSVAKTEEKEKRRQRRMGARMRRGKKSKDTELEEGCGIQKLEHSS